ncbi:MAG: DUF6588 family protein [bacterium]
MKANLCRAVFAFVLLFCMIPAATAQYFRFDNRQAYASEQDVEDAVETVLKFFSSFVGGGMYHTADLHDFGGLDVGLRGIVATIPDEFESVPVFDDENRIGLAFLHGSLGLPGRFELTGRFFYFPLGSDSDVTLDPPRAADSRGGVTLIGGGLKYGLVQLPGLPKVMLLAAYHALFVPEEFDFGTVSTFSLKAVASQSLPIFTVYVAGGIDLTRLKLDEDLPLFPDLGGKRFSGSEAHFTIGATVKPFPLLHVNASYSFSEFNTFDLGLGVSLW